MKWPELPSREDVAACTLWVLLVLLLTAGVAGVASMVYLEHSGVIHRRQMELEAQALATQKYAVDAEKEARSYREDSLDLRQNVIRQTVRDACEGINQTLQNYVNAMKREGPPLERLQRKR